MERAIDAIADSPNLGPDSQRHYDLLFNRYVQQFTQAAVANQLGVSPRQLRREQEEAIGVLAEYLRRQYGLVDGAISLAHVGMEEGEHRPLPEELDQEIRSLQEKLASDTADVQAVLREAEETVTPLARAHGVDLLMTAEAGLQVVLAPTVLKQVVLNLLSALITCAGQGDGRAAVAVQAHDDWVAITLEAHLAARTRPPGSLDLAKVEISRALLESFAGHLNVSFGGDTLSFSVMVPSARQVRVLAIEDNADTLQLWQRYLQNTRFLLIPCGSPERALEAVLEQSPDLVVLDIMMPGIDGWQLLSNLRHHPDTRDLPVVVCSVLPQEELARSLGASDFVGKPTTRQCFLECLIRQNEDATRPRRPRSLP